MCGNTPFYVRLSMKEIYEFDIRIKGVNDQDASFLQEPTLLTLCFERETWILRCMFLTQKWVNHLNKKSSDIFQIDNSTIKLNSPVQSVVDRAKLDLKRINTAYIFQTLS